MASVISPARILAFEVLLAVEEGGYASDLLAARSGGLSPRDTALANEIVFGVLRFQAQLDFLIERYSGRLSARLDVEVRVALRMTVYQIRYLDRVPAHAAVGESVELVKRARKRSAAGFVNAVLRKVDRTPCEWPDRAVALSHPAWLLDRWERQYGSETALDIARANLAAPQTYLRIPRGRDTTGLELEPTALEGCYRLLSGDAARFRRQDIGSQSVVPLLDLAPGQTFLDLCAAPGNKTAQALEYGVRATACDVRLRRLRELAGLAVDRVVLDGTRPLPFRRKFDRILVDAPCSGTGTLGRNPEIKWRLQPAGIAAFRERQAALLFHAFQLLAGGGILVYSTCSLEGEENEDVVSTVPPEYVVGIMRRIPGRDPGDGFFAAVIKLS